MNVASTLIARSRLVQRLICTSPYDPERSRRPEAETAYIASRAAELFRRLTPLLSRVGEQDAPIVAVPTGIIGDGDDDSTYGGVLVFHQRQTSAMSDIRNEIRRCAVLQASAMRDESVQKRGGYYVAHLTAEILKGDIIATVFPQAKVGGSS